MKLCDSCHTAKAFIKRPKTGKPICQPCFFTVFEQEIHETIINNNLFRKGDRVAIGTSGGKDSTVIAHVMNKLNKQHNYGLDLFMLSIDEGIQGYRDDSLETVKRNQVVEELPLQILSYKDLYGWTMDQIVKQIGTSNNCTYCGVFRRQALERGALKLKCHKIVTGHNADDIAETVLLNMLRGDFVRLSGCVNPMSGEQDDPLSIPRVKPFKYTYEKEIVMYAHHKRLEYFSTECVYSPFAFRGHVRELIKKLEAQRPSSIVDIIYSAENIKVDFTEEVKMPERLKCTECGFITSQKRCKACVLLEGLNKGKAKLGIKKTK